MICTCQKLSICFTPLASNHLNLFLWVFPLSLNGNFILLATQNLDSSFPDPSHPPATPLSSTCKIHVVTAHHIYHHSGPAPSPVPGPITAILTGLSGSVLPPTVKTRAECCLSCQSYVGAHTASWTLQGLPISHRVKAQDPRVPLQARHDMAPLPLSSSNHTAPLTLLQPA